MDSQTKEIAWIGRARREYEAFPAKAMRDAGHALAVLQSGCDPEDWKPMETIGRGACELRVRVWDGGTVHYRVIYVARFPEAVYVLHAFEKKTEATSRHDLEVARVRYSSMLRERRKLQTPAGKEPR